MARWPDDDRTPLAQIRVKAGYTIETAAVALGITGRTLGRYEKAQTDVPSRTLGKMIPLYNVNCNEILTAINDTWLKKEAEAERRTDDAKLLREALAKNAATQADEAVNPAGGGSHD